MSLATKCSIAFVIQLLVFLLAFASYQDNTGSLLILQLLSFPGFVVGLVLGWPPHSVGVATLTLAFVIDFALVVWVLARLHRRRASRPARPSV